MSLSLLLPRTGLTESDRSSCSVSHFTTMDDDSLTRVEMCAAGLSSVGVESNRDERNLLISEVVV